MLQEFNVAVRMTVVTIAFTGLVYPLVSTGAAQVLFADQAGGSLERDEKTRQVIGSRLIGQPFTRPEYFQPRPSAAGGGYDGKASGGSNFGVTSQKLRDRVAQDVERLKRENPDAVGPIPADLVTASASGLDPHISPAAAEWQVPRVAQARGVDAQRVRGVVRSQTIERTFGVLGEPCVNVLLLNLALDRQFGKVLEAQP